jgi:hypothetical protein
MPLKPAFRKINENAASPKNKPKTGTAKTYVNRFKL